VGMVAVLLAAGCGQEEPADTIPPARIGDLAVAAVTQSTVGLTWTATGGDGDEGRASSYDLRYIEGILTEENWPLALPAEGEPEPGEAGTRQSMTVSGLRPATDYGFAVRAADQAGNLSAMSNVAPARTLSPAGGWIVSADGAGHFSTIAAAVAAAADGDTILVRPGLYAEALSLEGRTLALFGAGAESTVVSYGTAGQDVPVLRIRGGEVVLRDLRLTQEFIACGVGLRCGAGAIVRLERCALLWCGISAESSSLALDRCTVWALPPMLCDMIVPLIDLVDSPAHCAHGIVGGAPQVRCSGAGAFSAECSDFWQIAFTGCPSPVGSGGNIGRDPLFVDPSPEGSDFRLLATSPCLPGQTPGCGGMGAFGAFEP